jgi:hypothetical protein
MIIWPILQFKVCVHLPVNKSIWSTSCRIPSKVWWIGKGLRALKILQELLNQVQQVTLLAFQEMIMAFLIFLIQMALEIIVSNFTHSEGSTFKGKKRCNPPMGWFFVKCIKIQESWTFSAVLTHFYFQVAEGFQPSLWAYCKLLLVDPDWLLGL